MMNREPKIKVTTRAVECDHCNHLEKELVMYYPETSEYSRLICARCIQDIVNEANDVE